MEENKYCETTTKNHTVSCKHKTCLHPIETLLEQEGLRKCNRLFNSNHVVLNLDKVEIAQGKGRRDCTCDFVFGTSKEDRNRKMVLTECKFNLKSGTAFNSHFGKDILSKINYSKSLIGSEIPFSEKNYVLIENVFLKEGKNRFNRLFRESKIKVIPMDINLLHEIFFR